MPASRIDLVLPPVDASAPLSAVDRVRAAVSTSGALGALGENRERFVRDLGAALVSGRLSGIVAARAGSTAGARTTAGVGVSLAKSLSSVVVLRLVARLTRGYVSSVAALAPNVPEIARLANAIARTGVRFVEATAPATLAILESIVAPVASAAGQMARFGDLLISSTKVLAAALQYGVNLAAATGVRAISWAAAGIAQGISLAAQGAQWSLERYVAAKQDLGSAWQRYKASFIAAQGTPGGPFGQTAGAALGFLGGEFSEPGEAARFLGEETAKSKLAALRDRVMLEQAASLRLEAAGVMAAFLSRMDAFYLELQGKTDASSAALRKYGAEFSDDLRAMIGSGGAEPPPSTLENYAKTLSDMAQAPLWQSIVTESRAAVKSLEHGVSAILKAADLGIRSFSGHMGETIPGLMSKPLAATNALNAAFQANISILSGMAGSSERAAAAMQRAELGAIATLAAVLAGVEIAQGVAASLDGDAGAAVAHFTAAGAYGVAAVLAGGGAVAGADTAKRQIDEAAEGTSGAMSRRVGANLTVIMPGYSNPDDIARALTQAINSDVAGEQRYARSDFAIARGATGRSLLNGLGRQYVRLQAQAATENALNTVGGSA
ncbi:MAG TPA: hypothetical protein VEA38_09770, partial [Terriglobales bacterium]|nr:hypothetical protein [Terriglobales bacterium]